MTPPFDPIAQVRTLLGDLRLGVPSTVGGLTLLPLIGGTAAPSYLTAAQATAAGTLTIGELADGAVPQLVVQNVGEMPVLFLDGEHLEGAMQDRVLNASVLVAARHETVIPVSCVERGRWHYAGARRDVTPGADHAYAELRAMNADRVASSTRTGGVRLADQGAVWADVERKRTQLRAGPSQTSALRDAYEQRRADLERVRRAFVAPGPEQTGVLAVAGGCVLALDVFDRASTLADYWDRLVRGYALDALGAEPVASAEDAASATAFWGELTHPDNDATAHEGVGLGIDVILTSPRTVANALTWGRAVVHLAAFPRERSGHRPDRRRPAPRAGRIEHPSVRARELRRIWFHEDGAPDGRSER
jgi:hypothetical protein